MIEKTYFVLAVPNLKKSGDYYRNVLGFEIQEMGDPGWRFFVKDNCCIMAGECPNALPANELGDHSYFAYMKMKNIDEYFSLVKERNAEFIKPLRNESWGMREFGIRTIDGHRIMFGSPIST